MSRWAKKKGHAGTGSTWKRGFWERARVGDTLFHDPELQRAYWDTWGFFATRRALLYVQAVFQRCGDQS